MGTQFKTVVTGDPLGPARQVDSGKLRPWDVSETVRDHFRRVRSSLNLASHQGALCVAVSSTCRGEGVSWVTAMLSCAVAEEGQPVVVIDNNRSSPSQNKLFGLHDGPGTLLAAGSSADLAVRSSSCYDIRVLTPEPSALKAAFSLRDVLPKLRLKNDFLLIDCEPMRDSSQLLDLAPAVDGVIFVVEAERERREVLARNLESIRRAGTRVLGIVLNKRKRYIPAWLYRSL